MSERSNNAVTNEDVDGFSAVSRFESSLVLRESA